MKKCFILTTLILSSSQVYAQDAKHCDSVLEHGARNFISRMDFNSQKAYVYSKACNSQYRNSTGDTKLGIEAIIKKIPIGINLGKSNKTEQIQKWCKENESLSSITTQTRFNENLVYGPAVDAWLNCKEAYASGLKVSAKIGSNNRSIAFQITNTTTDEKVILRGVNISESTISCTASTDKESVDANIQTRLPLHPNQSLNINCNRKDKSVTRDGQKIDILPSGTITINTKIKNYQISLPEHSSVSYTDKKARQLNKKLDQLLVSITNQFKALKEIPPRAIRPYTSSRGQGANSMTMASYCPMDQIMVGIEMIIGGTCRNQCDGDGGAFHKYRIMCAPRFK